MSQSQPRALDSDAAERAQPLHPGAFPAKEVAVSLLHVTQDDTTHISKGIHDSNEQGGS